MKHTPHRQGGAPLTQPVATGRYLSRAAPPVTLQRKVNGIQNMGRERALVRVSHMLTGTIHVFQRGLVEVNCLCVELGQSPLQVGCRSQSLRSAHVVQNVARSGKRLRWEQVDDGLQNSRVDIVGDGEESNQTLVGQHLARVQVEILQTVVATEADGEDWQATATEARLHEIAGEESGCLASEV
ncbi:hypothetical protein HYQ46_004982 [Verticillium longisporum]|nr:hypothetical protein HYQ46_004982 [Verticillium longisporum]